MNARRVRIEARGDRDFPGALCFEPCSKFPLSRTTKLVDVRGACFARGNDPLDRASGGDIWEQMKADKEPIVLNQIS